MSVIPQTSKTYTGFTPTTIPGCQLWLDAADSSSITLTGSNVTTWADKSGSGNNATGGVSPTYLNNSIVFDGTQYLTTTYTAAPSIENVFVVATITGTTNTKNFFILAPTNNNERGYTVNLTSSVYTVNWDKSGVARYASTSGIQQNTMFMTTGIYTGTTLSTNLNGGSQSTSVSASFSGTGQTKIGAIVSQISNTSWVGKMNEIITFNSALTTSQIQQVEGYLARKWGLTSNLPSTHPYKNIPLFTRVFTPIDIPNCALWFDGADSSSMTFSGSTVTQWRDKSGNNNNTTSAPGTVTLSTINNRQCLNFPTVSDRFYVEPLAVAANTTTITTFAVISMTNNATTYGRIVSFSRTADGTTNNDYSSATNYIINRSVGTTNLQIYRNSAQITTSTVASYSTPLIIAAQFDGTNCTGYLNGTSFGSFGSSGTFTFNRMGIAVNINTKTSNQDNYTGLIGEIIMYYASLTTSERQQVEGYLANKWGLRSNLPSTHPFRLYPSLTTIFNPLQISGCSLWLDSYDSSTITLSGSNVTAWADKSGSGNNATATSGNPTYSISTGVFFGGATRMASAVSASVNTESGFIIINNTATGYQGVLGCTITYNREIRIQSAAEGNVISVLNQNAVGLASSSIALPKNTDVLVSYHCGSAIWLDGTSRGTASAASFGSGGAGTTIIGASNSGGSNPFTGYIKEIILYNVILTSSQRQQIEGYLAWKWGLQNNLPSTHTFKKFRP